MTTAARSFDSVPLATTPEMSPERGSPTQTSPSIGRRIMQIGASFFHNLPKIVGVGALALAAISASIPAPIYAMPMKIQVQTEDPQITTAVAYNASLQKFPSYTARYMNPGFQLVHNGTKACAIESQIEPQEACVETIEAYMKKNPEAADFEWAAEFNFKYSGTPYEEVPKPKTNQTTVIRLHVNPQQMTNYNTALQYVEKAVLSWPIPFQGSANKTIGIIKKIHRLLTSNLPDAKEIAPGRFRSKPLTENYHNKLVHDLFKDDFKERIKGQLQEKQFDIFMKGYEKYINGRGFSEFTQDELEIWKQFFDIPPSPEDIPRELTTFARTLKSMLAKENPDAVEVASFVHTEFLRIRPFAKGNGKTARLLMDTVLQHLSDSTVIFPSYTEYLKKVKATAKKPDSKEIFTNYLKDVVIPWNMAQKERLIAEANPSTKTTQTDPIEA